MIGRQGSSPKPRSRSTSQRAVPKPSNRYECRSPIPILRHSCSARGTLTQFVFPANQAAIFAKQFLERGMDKSGIRLLGTGDLTDDDELPGMTDAELGIITAHHYSALHDSPVNKTFVRDFQTAYGK